MTGCMVRKTYPQFLESDSLQQSCACDLRWSELLFSDDRVKDVENRLVTNHLVADRFGLITCARFGFRKTVTSKAGWIGAGSGLKRR